ncbi:MAG: HesA/MoeB/ThiF family protein [Spirochaetes bacterium]|nr:HesA/MoeB/ThiF family protein [Spirochaetota bacterium]
MLASEERSIYSRQLSIPSWGDDTQEKLKRSRAFIAGCGGLGSPVLCYLAAAGVGTLVICDNDSVDSTNLNRQIIHRHDRIGMPKTESARMTIEKLNPFTRTELLAVRLDDGNAMDLIGDSDIIIDCLDSFASRHVLNHVSVARGIPLVHGGVSGFIGQVSFFDPPETPCFACLFTGGIDSSRDIVGATPGIVGSIQAMEAVKHLAGLGETLRNRLLFIDGFAMKFETVTVTKNPQCVVCGKK